MRIPVVFRIDDTKEVTAIFINEQGTSDPNTRVCYTHLGQYGACSMKWVKQDTRPATKDQYSTLLDELARLVGYKNLFVLRDLRGTK